MSLPARVVTALLCLGFVAAGSAVVVLGALRPAWQLADAQGWTERACTITHSEVVHSVDSDGDDRYRVVVTYRYEVGGARHHGQRRSFGSASASRRDAQATVARLPAGATVSCWVDPDDPGSAVLERTGFSWWGGPFGLAFQLAGVFALAGALAGHERRPRARIRGQVLEIRPIWVDVSTVAFAATLVAVQLIVTAIGLVKATLVLQAAGYLAAAAVAAALAVHRFGQWATGLRLEITPPAVAIGQRAQVRWTLRAPFGVGRGRLRLLGREVVVIGSGSNTTVRTRTFHEVELAELTSRQAAAPIDLAIPAGHLPSFVAGNARVEWELAVHVELPRWPDLDVTVPIDVAPAPVGVPRARPPRLDAKPPPPGDQLALDATTQAPGTAITGVVGWRRDLAPDQARVELRRHVEIVEGDQRHTEVVAAVDVAELARLVTAAEAGPYRGVVEAGRTGARLEAIERRELHLPAPTGPVTQVGELLEVGWSLALVIDGDDRVTAPIELRDPPGSTPRRRAGRSRRRRR